MFEQPHNNTRFFRRTVMAKRTKKVEAAEATEAVEVAAAVETNGEATTETTATTKPKKTKSKKAKAAAMSTVAKKGTKNKKKDTPPKTKKPKGPSRTVEVGGEQWPRKKAQVLFALQNLKDECTKKEIIDLLEKEFKANEDKVNIFCYELADEGYAEVNYYEGERGHKRMVTKKGLKVKLPSLN